MLSVFPLLLAAALPGTESLTREGDVALQMVEGIDRYLARTIGSLRVSEPGSKERFSKIIGAVDPRAATPELERRGVAPKPGAIGVYSAKWLVFDGVDGEGILLEPAGKAAANLVLLPDASQSPESIAASVGGAVAAGGYRVLIPLLIDRSDEFSGNPSIRMTNQPHREFIYRMAYQAGRHIIGYEVQKVLAAVDWYKAIEPSTPVIVAGYGEGGLIALYSAALDDRIAKAVVSGYFQDRRNLFREPVYRNVWGLLPEFGDAALARMMHPRPLFVHPAAPPSVSGPPPERPGRTGAAPGAIASPPIQEIREEAARAAPASVTVLDDNTSASYKQAILGRPAPPLPALAIPAAHPDRMRRQFRQLVEYTQRLVRQSEQTRRAFWKEADFTSPESWARTRATYERQFREEFIGDLPRAANAGKVQTRKLYDTHAFEGYEAVIPVRDEVFAYGVLLFPKGMRPGERRPLVIAQHGLEGRPQEIIQPTIPGEMRTYQRFAARLAERGFIVFAPQNPYIHGARFRELCRKGDPLRLSLFAFITAQYRQTIDWLQTLPFVDKDRIGFYGLSYGGTTALRVPPLEPRIKAIVCSGNFNEWSWKITSDQAPFSYMFTREYEIYEFNQTETFGHAEMVYLMAPRPFFVERGHHDGVGIDEWVSYEFAKVRRFYAQWGMADRTGIEYFNGVHQIWGNEAFTFLHRHLRWP